MYKDFLVDFWFNLATRIRVLTLIFILLVDYIINLAI